MGTRMPGLGVNSDNKHSNAFKNLGDSLQVMVYGANHHADAMLQLHPIGSAVSDFPTSKGVKRKWGSSDGNTGLYVDPTLCLGLGHSLSASDSKDSSATACTAVSSAKETEAESLMDLDLDFSLHLVTDKFPTPKKPAFINGNGALDLELSLSTGPCESDLTSIHGDLSAVENDQELPFWRTETSSIPSVGTTVGRFLSKMNPPHSTRINIPTSMSVTCTSGIAQQIQQLRRGSNSKICKFTGCVKGARGASGLCIAHGGGRRCKRSECTKGAEGRTAFCKAHGGGRRCEFLGCTKSAEGRTDYCIAHGGGRRCGHDGCTRAARGGSGLCIRHGGGKRCQVENCLRSAEGLSGLCISHGGGRRCQYEGCSKGAQGNTLFCKAHGGGKRCTVEGCTKGAEGSTTFCKGHGGGKRCSFLGCPKCVHGGTAFCVAHGGGKRCSVAGCTKSARGRTDFCVRHGGGKRCQFEGCGKSAQGSTDFCKAHGSLLQDKRVHGGFTVGPMVQEDATAISINLVKKSMQIGSSDPSLEICYADNEADPSPSGEGRVHGGSLMALLSGGSSLPLTRLRLQ